MFAYVLNSNKSAIEKRKKFLVIDVCCCCLFVLKI